MRFGLTEKQIGQITALLGNAEVSKAIIFGSRAKGCYRNNSDIDIAVWGSNINIGRLLAELDELPMPYKFDVIDYEKITDDALRNHIDSVGITFSQMI